MPPKILVGCPTASFKAYCLDAYIQGVKALQYPSFDVVLVDNSPTPDYSRKLQAYEGITVIKDEYREGAKDRIVHSRNILRELVLHNGYDAFFSLEQDVIPPPNVLNHLVQHHKDVVSGVYYKDYNITDKQGNTLKRVIMPLAYKKSGTHHLQQLTAADVAGSRLLKIAACGLGCILITKKILEQVTFRVVPDKEPFDDIWFCKDCEEHNYSIYLDTSIKSKHLTEGMDWKNIKK